VEAELKGLIRNHQSSTDHVIHVLRNSAVLGAAAGAIAGAAGAKTQAYWANTNVDFVPLVPALAVAGFFSGMVYAGLKTIRDIEPREERIKALYKSLGSVNARLNQLSEASNQEHRRCSARGM
jgi:hypothetical protein